MSAKHLTSSCPFCEGTLEITHLHCTSCDTQLTTTVGVPAFFRLPTDLQEFVLIFLQCRGNIREVGKQLGISYPTVCKRLDLVNERLGQTFNPSTTEDVPPAVTRESILSQVESGELSTREAAKQLKRL
ncbi:MAG: DUF2089 family protein [Verrucomicrobiota bacterium]